ncbi:Tetracycline transcriptional regulator, TetR-related, C-terminal [Syntrophomonas zehnderi OL-4]|jgi:TetR/AcrR family transcriptional regulator|uniref:Tetracycline transcriptional regulator, TetR-related, C-terminal n=1 Tax=Syntrophomonas zehnderi OL-4 TaxID=690567 RepID=A0A0E4GET2_9FIRM|nr:TetR/AcrR family transcriptional regulator [Syntrophomonas zehnderi]CFX96253.1 Tetracycline transcriptional regulator, TetR-related, C-terminal [Syntrophomonas zehnderi OL-4]
MFSKFLSLEPERRNAILNAALREFASKGFDDASTNVIAKESGISKPLMFHYVNNKKDFFLFLYDYCLDILEREYFDRIDLHEKDIFERLRQTCLLKIQVMQKYPWIFDFIRVVVFTDSDEVKDELKKRRKMVEASIFERFYGDIDTSRFRSELDVEKAKQLIFWAVSGYAGEILEQFRSNDAPAYDFEKIRAEFDDYLNELRKTYYK